MNLLGLQSFIKNSNMYKRYLHPHDMVGFLKSVVAVFVAVSEKRSKLKISGIAKKVVKGKEKALKSIGFKC